MLTCACCCVWCEVHACTIPLGVKAIYLSLNNILIFSKILEEFQELIMQLLGALYA